MALNIGMLQTKAVLFPPRVAIVGTHGIGKTSLCAAAPAPVILQAGEDGMGMLDIPSFGILRDYSSVLEAIGVLYNEVHDRRTLIVDALDSFEPMVWAHTATENKWADIETPGYGRGYVAAVEYWRNFLDALDMLRLERDMTILLISHSEIKKFSPPDAEPYDRYRMKLQDRARALIMEQMDVVLFANYRMSTVKTETGTGKIKQTHTRGVSAGERVLYCEERPSHEAKNRYHMPAEIVLPKKPELGWDTVAQYLPYYGQVEAPAVTAGADDDEAGKDTESAEDVPPVEAAAPAPGKPPPRKKTAA